MKPPIQEIADNWLEVLAATHVIVIHFPIALLAAAALFEIVSALRQAVGKDEGRPSGAALPSLVLAAMGAAAAAASGWTLAERTNFGSAVAEQILWHRWTGVAVAVLSIMAVLPGLVSYFRPANGMRRWYRAFLLAAAGAASLAGHQGGGLVHGTTHLTDPLMTALFGAEEPELVEDPKPLDGDAEPQPVSGAEQVLALGARTILADRCVECHGPTKTKGDLRLDTRVAIVDEGFAAEPGDAAGSLIVERIILPAEHEDLMPAEGDPLTPAEIALLSAWIDAGVPWPADGEPAGN